MGSRGFAPGTSGDITRLFPANSPFFKGQILNNLSIENISSKGFVMTKVSLTYDGFQHATSVQEERKNARGKTVATDCPYTGKGEEFSPLELTGTGVAGCCLISMGTLAMRREIDISGTRLDIELSWTKKMDRIGAIDLTFTMARNYSPKERYDVRTCS